MSTLEDICEKYYGTKNFYKILCVNKYSPLDDVKKAYRRLSLQVHPDRNDQDENHIATEKFKILSKIYQILINPDAKTLYDEKGMVDDGSGTSLNQSSNVPKANMETVKNHFVGSKHEEKAIREAYLKCEGDLIRMTARVPFLTFQDKKRVCEIIEKWIAIENDVPNYLDRIDSPAVKHRSKKTKSIQ